MNFATEDTEFSELNFLISSGFSGFSFSSIFDIRGKELNNFEIMMQKIALVAAILLPFWNLPLIFRIIKRRSSNDISIHWAIGVWTCLILMAPSAFVSEDLVWRVFNIINLVLFSLVVAAVLVYRKRNSNG